jgi:hypothetical protein
MYNQSALPTSAICNVQKQQEQAWTQKWVNKILYAGKKKSN